MHLYYQYRQWGAPNYFEPFCARPPIRYVNCHRGTGCSDCLHQVIPAKSTYRRCHLGFAPHQERGHTIVDEANRYLPGPWYIKNSPH